MTPLHEDTTQIELHLSARGYHAVAALVLLARLGEGGPVPLAALTRAGDGAVDDNPDNEEGSVSQSYLEQLFAKLRRAGIVKSTRGPGGGYSLSRPARDISLADIFIAENGEPLPSAQTHSALRRVQSYVGGTVYEALSRRTLADVLRHSRPS